MINMKDVKEKTKKVTKRYGFSSFGLTGLLCVIFGLIGAVVGGFAGLAVGVVMALMASLIAWVGLIPFAGIFLFMGLYNTFMDWLYTLAPQMNVLLSPDALPRVILFYIFGILSGIACVIFSFIAVIVIFAGIVAILEYRS